MKIKQKVVSDFDYENVKFPPIEEQKRFFELSPKSKRELFQIYLSTTDEKEKRVIKNVFNLKNGELETKVILKESTFSQPVTRECDIKDIDI